MHNNILVWYIDVMIDDILYAGLMISNIQGSESHSGWNNSRDENRYRRPNVYYVYNDRKNGLAFFSYYCFMV